MELKLTPKPRATKVNKSRGYKKKISAVHCQARMRSAFPVLIKLQNLLEKHPKEVFDILVYLASSNSVQMLDATEKDKLIAYLNKWGYDSSWVRA